MQNKKQQKRKSNRRTRKQGVVGMDVTKTIFPPVFKGVLIFNQAGALNNLGSGGVASQVYRANSIYDPDFTGVGITANGVSLLSQLYDRYRVTFIKAEVEFNVVSGVGGEAFVVFSNSNSLGTSVAPWIGQRFVWKRAIGGASGNNIARFAGGGPISTFYGVRKQQVEFEDDFMSVMGNNPNNQVFMHVGWHSNATAAASTTLLTFNVRIEYTTRMSLPLTIPP